MKCKKGFKKVNNKCIKEKPHYRNKTEPGRRLINIILIFSIFAFLGALLELTYGNIANGVGIFYSKGLLLLVGIKIPFLPIYGFGGLILISILNALDNTKVKFLLRGFIVGVAIIIFELISAGITYLLFGKYLWDYSAHFMNLNGAISLQVSILWIISVYIITALYLRFRKNRTFRRFTQIL